jgi:LPXTG-motif cell wall-anchored protein
LPQSDVNSPAQSGTATSTDPNAAQTGDQNATGTRARRNRRGAAGTNQAGATSDQNANGGALPKTGSELPLLALGGLSTFITGLGLKLKARKR